MSGVFIEDIDYSLDDKRVSICNLTPAELNAIICGLHWVVDSDVSDENIDCAEALLKVIDSKDLAQDA